MQPHALLSGSAARPAGDVSPPALGKLSLLNLISSKCRLGKVTCRLSASAEPQNPIQPVTGRTATASPPPSQPANEAAMPDDISKPRLIRVARTAPPAGLDGSP